MLIDQKLLHSKITNPFWLPCDSWEMKSKFWVTHPKMCVISKLQNGGQDYTYLGHSLFLIHPIREDIIANYLSYVYPYLVIKSYLSHTTCGKSLQRPPLTECQRRCPQRITSKLLLSMCIVLQLLIWYLPVFYCLFMNPPWLISTTVSFYCINPGTDIRRFQLSTSHISHLEVRLSYTCGLNQG